MSAGGNPYERYLQGLALLLRLLAQDRVRHDQITVWGHRLTESIEHSYRYGDTPDRKSERAQLIEMIHGLALEALGRSFDDICREAVAPDPAGPPAPAYYITSAVVDTLHQITTTPGYHLVLAEAGFGKTALIGYLAQLGRLDVVSYTFSRTEGRVAVELALEALREQLKARGNLPSAYNHSFAQLIEQVVKPIQPWSLARKRNWPQLLILLDGLDECDEGERGLFQGLLPANISDNVAVVVTMRLHVHETIVDCLPSSHPLRQAARQHLLQPLDVADIRRLLAEQHHIYVDLPFCRKIKKLSGGHPAAVIAVCRSLDEAIRQAHDPDEALRQIPPVHTFRDLFDHELDQMERHCPSDEERLLLHGLLGALAAARQPLGPAQLAAVLGASPGAIEGLARRLDRFLSFVGDGSLSFSHPQFVEYLHSRGDWKERLASLQGRWDAWIALQVAAQPLVAELLGRIGDHLIPALQRHNPRWLADEDALFSPAIQTREDWLAAISRAWEAAEGRAPSPARPAELLIYALLITSWPQGLTALPQLGADSPDAQPALLLTDQLRDVAQPPGGLELRDVATLLDILADEAQTFEEFALLVSELGQAWRAASGDQVGQFARILRLITQAVRRQATVSPLPSPRANLLEALISLAPAIQDHFPGSVDGICHVVDAIIEVLP